MQPEAQLDLVVSELEFNDESVDLIVRSLALEAHHFALSRGVLETSVEDQLQLVFGILDGQIGNLLDVVDVPAVNASCIGSIVLRFSDEVYLGLTLAAQNAVAHSFDGDADV